MCPPHSRSDGAGVWWSMKRHMLETACAPAGIVQPRLCSRKSEDAASLSLMKAARIHQHGGPDVLTYEDVPDPTIKANHVLIRVRACALNHLDLFVRAGIPGMTFPCRTSWAATSPGEVVEVGELCERVKPGWRVLLSPGAELPAVRAVPARATTTSAAATPCSATPSTAATPNCWPRPNTAPSRFPTI